MNHYQGTKSFAQILIVKLLVIFTILVLAFLSRAEVTQGPLLDPVIKQESGNEGKLNESISGFIVFDNDLKYISKAK